jgi:hypothetical protein
MNTLVPSNFRSRIRQNVSAYPRRLVAACLAFAGFILAATGIQAINHPPFVSWIPDQRIRSGGFATQYFRIITTMRPGLAFPPGFNQPIRLFTLPAT